MVIIKQCGGCKTFKNIIEFCKCRTGKYGVHNHCRSCAKEHKAKYYANNRDKEIVAAAIYAKSPKGIKARKSHYSKNKDQVLARNRKLRSTPKARKLANIARNKKYHNDINFRIAVTSRSRMKKALKGIDKSKHTLELLGCSINELKTHLENKFLPISGRKPLCRRHDYLCRRATVGSETNR